MAQQTKQPASGQQQAGSVWRYFGVRVRGDAVVFGVGKWRSPLDCSNKGLPLNNERRGRAPFRRTRLGGRHRTMSAVSRSQEHQAPRPFLNGCASEVPPQPSMDGHGSGARNRSVALIDVRRGPHARATVASTVAEKEVAPWSVPPRAARSTCTVSSVRELPT